VALGLTEGWLPPATELDLWEERWLDCGRHLCQWTMVGAYARQVGDALAEAEAASRLGDWSRLKECLRLPASVAEAAKAPELRLYEAELSLADPAAGGVATWQAGAGPASVANAISNAASYAGNSQAQAAAACDAAAGVALRVWANGPRLAGAAIRGQLLQTAQRIQEMRESVTALAQVRAAFRAAQLAAEQARGAAASAAAAAAAADGLPPPAAPPPQPATATESPDLRHLLSTWRDRLPNAWEGMPAWDGVHTWRHHVFSLISAPAQALIPGSGGQPWVRVPPERLPLLQDAPWTVIRLAHVARKLGLKDVAAVMLARLDGGPPVSTAASASSATSAAPSPASLLDPADAFMRVREQLLVNLPDRYSAAYNWLTTKKNLAYREQALQAYLHQEAATLQGAAASLGGAGDGSGAAPLSTGVQARKAAFRAISTCFTMASSSLPQARAHAAGGLALINQQLDGGGSGQQQQQQQQPQTLEQRSEVWRLRGMHGEWLGPEAFPAAFAAFSAACQTGRHHGKNWLSWALFLERLYAHARIECRLPADVLRDADDAPAATSAATMQQWASAMGVSVSVGGSDSSKPAPPAPPPPPSSGMDLDGAGISAAPDATPGEAAALGEAAAASAAAPAPAGHSANPANPILVAAKLVASSALAHAALAALASSTTSAPAAAAAATSATAGAPDAVVEGSASTGAASSSSVSASGIEAGEASAPTSGPALAQAVAAQAVAAYCAAVALRCSRPGMQLGRALWLVHSEEESGGGAPAAVLAALQSGSERLPAWLWLQFMPLLLAACGRGEAVVSRRLLVALSAAYPQATLHHLLALATPPAPAAAASFGAGPPGTGGLSAGALASSPGASSASSAVSDALATARRLGGAAAAAAERLVVWLTGLLRAQAISGEEETANQLAGLAVRCQQALVSLALGKAREAALVGASSSSSAAPDAQAAASLALDARYEAKDREYAQSLLAAVPKLLGLRLFPPPAATMPLAARLRILRSNRLHEEGFRKELAALAGAAPVSPAPASVGVKRTRRQADSGSASQPPLSGPVEDGAHQPRASVAALVAFFQRWHQALLAGGVPLAIPLTHTRLFGGDEEGAPVSLGPKGEASHSWWHAGGGGGALSAAAGMEVPGQYGSTPMDAEPFPARHVRAVSLSPVALLTVYGAGDAPAFPGSTMPGMASSSSSASPSSNAAAAHGSQGALCRRLAFVGDDGGRHWFTAAPAVPGTLLPDSRSVLRAKALNATMAKYPDTRSRQLSLTPGHFTPTPSPLLRLVPSSPAEVSLAALLDARLAAAPVLVRGLQGEAGSRGPTPPTLLLRSGDDLLALYEARLRARGRGGSTGPAVAGADTSDRVDGARGAGSRGSSSAASSSAAAATGAAGGAGVGPPQVTAVAGDAYRDVCAALPASALTTALQAGAPSADAMLALRGRLTGQVAVSSIWGFLLTAGDRLPSRLVIDRSSGAFSSLDQRQSYAPSAAHLGYVAEANPEAVPLRLTRNLCAALTPQGLLGPYVAAMSAHIRMQFAHADVLAALLSVLAWDDAHDMLQARAAAVVSAAASLATASRNAGDTGSAASSQAVGAAPASQLGHAAGSGSGSAWSVAAGVEHGSVYRRVTSALGKWMDRITEMQSPTNASKLVAANLTGPANGDDMLSTSVHRLLLAAMADRLLACMPPAWHPWY